MNARISQHPAPDLLLTSSDRQRLNKAVLRIVGERCGVMLISSDAQLLARHSMFLVEMLPHDGNLQVSMIEEGEESLLLERFNGLLGHLSVDQARAAVTPEEAGHVWIMSVQSPAQYAAAKTIARMVHDFPGSNLSLVLLIEPEWAQALSKTRPGREMMRCTFKPGVKEYRHSAERPLTVSVKEAAKSEEGDGSLSGARASNVDSVATLVRNAQPQQRRFDFRMPAFILLLLIASAALVGMVLYAPGVSVHSTAQVTQLPLSSKTADSPGEAVRSSPETPSRPLLEADRPADMQPPPAVAQASEMASAADVGPQLPGAQAGALADRLAATQSWLASAPPGTYTIQLAGSNDERQLAAYLQRLRPLVKSEDIRVFRTKAGGRDSMTVILGSFADVRAAAAARDKLPAELRSAKPILRTVKGINSELKR